MTVFGRIKSLLNKTPYYIKKYGPEASKIFRNPLMRLALGSRSDIIADYIDKFTEKAPQVTNMLNSMVKTLY